jgi:hypothetical protein
MSVSQFLAYICYSTVNPGGVSPARWNGMLRWFETRQKERHGGGKGPSPSESRSRRAADANSVAGTVPEFGWSVVVQPGLGSSTQHPYRS